MAATDYADVSACRWPHEPSGDGTSGADVETTDTEDRQQCRKHVKRSISNRETPKESKCGLFKRREKGRASCIQYYEHLAYSPSYS